MREKKRLRIGVHVGQRSFTKGGGKEKPRQRGAEETYNTGGQGRTRVKSNSKNGKSKAKEGREER